MFAMAGIFAELESSLISSRVKLGQQRARAQGVRFGRPPIPPIDIDKVKIELEAPTIRPDAPNEGPGSADDDMQKQFERSNKSGAGK